MNDLTERTQKALAAPMAALLPADVRALIVDLAREVDFGRAAIEELQARVSIIERRQL